MSTRLSAIVFLKNEYELTGMVTDISENGIGIDTLKGMCPENYIHIRDVIKFQFVDDCSNSDDGKTNVVFGDAIITNMHLTDEGYLHIGCLVRDQAYSRYVTHKKFGEYYRDLCHFA